MAVDTKRQEYVDYYFQKVQDTIKDKLSKDKKLKPDDIQKFNDAIFTQDDYDVRKDIQEYIDGASSGSVDLNVVADQILNKYYDMVFLNNFNKDNINDIENPLDEKRLMKFSNFLKESNSKKTYFIPWSSWFDMNKYDVEKIQEILSLFLEDESWIENQYGQDNLPKVVCFLANYNIIPKITDKLNREFDTQWIRINEKDW